MTKAGIGSATAPQDFARFYHQYERLVRSLVAPLVGLADTDDVVQTTFLRCWERRDSLRDATAVPHWVATIALNQARDLWRRRKPTAPLPDNDSLVAPQGVSEPASKALMRALEALEFEHREVIVLRYFHDKSMHEMALLLAVPEGTVKSRLYHAKLRLQVVLTKMGVAYESR